MKKVIIVFFSVVILFASLLVLNAAKLENVQSVTVEDFNQQWSYVASKDEDKNKTQIKIIDGGANNAYLLGDKSAGNDQKKCMAAKTGFNHRGYNWIAFIPNKPVVLPGRAEKLQVWVLGMKYDYNLEVWLRDYKGVMHKIDMGSLNFEGWGSLIRNIPASIPQQEETYPKDRPLSIVKIVLRASPTERADRLYVFFDQINVYSDVYQKYFDGMDLINKAQW